MRRTWPFLFVVAGIGGVAGAAIAGRPEPPDPFIINPDAVPTTLGLVSITLGPTVTTSLVITGDVGTPVTTVVSVTAPPPVTTAATTASTTALPSTTTTTTTTTTTASTTSSPTTTTTVKATTTTVAAAFDRGFVRVVVANGARRSGLAQTVAARIANLGYISVKPATADQRVDTTIIYFQPGFADAARQLAVDLGLPEAKITALTDTRLTSVDGDGDVIVVLAGDPG